MLLKHLTAWPLAAVASAASPFSEPHTSFLCPTGPRDLRPTWGESWSQVPSLAVSLRVTVSLQ